MSEKIALKPCPFCGGRARLISLGHRNGTAFDDWGIECVKCGAMPWALEMYRCRTQEEILATCAERWTRRAEEEQE